MDPQNPIVYQPAPSYPPLPPQDGQQAPAGQQYSSPPPPSNPWQPQPAPLPAPYTATTPTAAYQQPIATSPADIPPVAVSQVMSVAQQVAQQINSANNVLVTVSNDPSVDQLCAAVGMTLILNKLGKHATAVFSGNIPPAIEFLQPEKTLEKNTDSLRDFIIALDKAKADKLRYKIEDKYVKIFITPYRTSIDQKDLQFSQGELNVDVVLALGVKIQNELDQAITAHGQILHDATVISINHQVGANLGSINWNETRTSSLCELVAKLAEALQPGQAKKLLDKQVATALLTGAVSETDRFSNSKTTPETMTMAAKLMDAGANQPLISSKLDKIKPIAALLPNKPVLSPPPKASQPLASPAPVNAVEPAKPSAPPDSIIDPDGSLHISHEDSEEEDSDIEKIHIDEFGVLQRVDASKAPVAQAPSAVSSVISTPAKQEVSPEPAPAPEPASAPVATDPALINGIADETLSDIEEAVHSPHLKDVPAGQPPAGPGPDSGSNALLGPDPSLPPIMNVKSSGGLEAPGSENVNDPASSDGPLFAPAGQGSTMGNSMSPPIVPPPIAPVGFTSTSPENLSDPNAGVPL